MGAGLFGRSRKGKKLEHIEFLDASHPRLPAQKPIKTLAWDRGRHRFPPGFYTYRLIDPANGLPFYVGKGQRSRAWQHERLVIAGDLSGNKRKVAKIQEILQRGSEVEIDIVACYALESDALDHEFRLVDSDPTLTNIAQGGAGAPLSDAAQDRKIALRREKMRRLRERERQSRLQFVMTERRSEFMSRTSNLSQGLQVEHWLDSLQVADAERVLAPRQYGARIGAVSRQSKRRHS